MSRKENESLCATCLNIDCSWHEWFEPVEGWTATPTIIQDPKRPMPSFKVHACPLYKTRDVKKIDNIITTTEIAKKTGYSQSYIVRLLKKGVDIFIDERKVCKKKNGEHFCYYLEKAQI